MKPTVLKMRLWLKLSASKLRLRMLMPNLNLSNNLLKNERVTCKKLSQSMLVRKYQKIKILLRILSSKTNWWFSVNLIVLSVPKLRIYFLLLEFSKTVKYSNSIKCLTGHKSNQPLSRSQAKELSLTCSLMENTLEVTVISKH